MLSRRAMTGTAGNTAQNVLSVVIRSASGILNTERSGTNCLKNSIRNPKRAERGKKISSGAKRYTTGGSERND